MDISTIRPEAAPVPLIEQPISAREAAERRDLVKAVKALNATSVLGENHELTFAVDRNSRRPVLRIVNRETREVVEQIPSEEVLRLAEGLDR
ncbi:MAG: flagellar protein FlaG [Bryobacteraceae bacterium]|nr:flagellar protein FlaG [Bryobacteraceae bacterium]